ncbi:MAG: hypothetical protein WAZ19_12275 [Anaerolineae bacterium]
MAGSWNKTKLEQIGIKKAGCNTVAFPCAIELSWEPRTREIELECGNGVDVGNYTLGFDVTASFAQADLDLISILTGKPIITTVTGSRHLQTGAGDTSPTVTLVGYGRNGAGQYVYVKFTDLVLAPVGGTWTITEFAITEITGFAKFMEYVESPAEIARINSELFSGGNPMVAYHVHEGTVTLLNVPVESGVIDSWCNEFDTQNPLIQATLNKQPSRNGAKVVFDGVDDTLAVAVLSPTPNTPALTTPIVIGMVVRIAEANASLTTPQVILQGASTAIQLSVADTFWRISGVATNLNFIHGGLWHRVMYVMNGGIHLLYIDGVLIGNVIGATPNLTALTLGQVGVTATLGMEVAALHVYQSGIPSLNAIIDDELAKYIP